MRDKSEEEDRLHWLHANVAVAVAAAAAAAAVIIIYVLLLLGYGRLLFSTHIILAFVRVFSFVFVFVATVVAGDFFPAATVAARYRFGRFSRARVRSQQKWWLLLLTHLYLTNFIFYT